MMTPKEEYEIRKARRKGEREAAEVLEDRRTAEEIDVIEMLDRVGTSLERIADALERAAKAKMETDLLKAYTEQMQSTVGWGIWGDQTFKTCPECGNKRCPKANNDLLKCTGSNEPDQPGSAYP